MIIARAHHEDLTAIALLEEEAFTHGRWSQDAWRGELEASDRHVLLARSFAGEVVGVATFAHVCEVADLNRVIVRADRRGEGIGRRLVRAGIEWAEALGVERMILEVAVENEAARALYDSLGFEAISRRRDYYGPSQDAVIMENCLLVRSVA